MAANRQSDSHTQREKASNRDIETGRQIDRKAERQSNQEKIHRDKQTKRQGYKKSERNRKTEGQIQKYRHIESQQELIFIDIYIYILTYHRNTHKYTRRKRLNGKKEERHQMIKVYFTNFRLKLIFSSREFVSLLRSVNIKKYSDTILGFACLRSNIF